jgi:Uma2 family endonuclease
MAAQERSDLPDPEVTPRQMTEEEFFAWCTDTTRAEWVDGEVVVFPPLTMEHSDLRLFLASLMCAVAEKADAGRAFLNLQVRFSDPPRRRMPDLWFIGKEQEHRIHYYHLEGPPDLAVEIVSPDSVARDWREKYLEYEAAGVREYWVIDPAQRHAEFYTLVPPPEQASAEPAKRFQRLPEKEGAITSTVLPSFRLPVAWLWLETRPNVVDAFQRLGIFPAQSPR